ncbi:hypothetical protein HET73_04555 [Wolbachia endosymbiont of Atemnus politus]|uniref:glycine-rich domain-containing protein n=1 Tax=Wolbachia endosymbiont of Atemnus politus TaxID=2682840 RepID=UPI001572CC35|nr:hypothetical protein [Wolbachia endosymbiont of Atemnus politus]NSM56696.1 hypothetical protein [Wolbachia endosymbiont of Atemnus politus]
MKNVGLNFLLILFLVFSFSYQGYADCSWWNIKSNTWFEAIVGGNWVKEIKVKAIKDQGVDGYFNPKIRVCAYDGKSYCYDLHSGTSCRQIYGTQSSGAGVSAAVFVDWEGTKEGDKMKNGMNWEWAEGVTKEEQEKFANSPKVCACSQKIACADSITKGAAGATSVSINECDTCYQTAVKCAPVPLAPGPPPFCEQLAMSPPQVRIVPITDKDNDYFNPRVGVMISGLEERKELGFPHVVSNNENIPNHSYTVTDKDTHYYFKTYRKKGQLCAEYRGTEREESERKLQFPARCFPAPPAPELEEVEIVDGNTLKIGMKMNARTRTFNVNTSQPTNVGPLSLKVVKPRIVRKATNSDNNKNNIGDVIENIFKNSSRFEILEQYELIPNIGVQFPDGDSCSLTNPNEPKRCESTKLRLDNMRQSKIEVRYMRVKDQENSNGKMLCLSGWQPEPEEFILKRESEIIPLKSMGAGYIKYNAVYSKESNQFYYLPSREREEKKEIYVDILTKPQDRLNDIVFDKQGYVFFPDENKQERRKCSYCVNENSKVNEAFQSGKGLKVVYKLIDGKREEKCEQGQDGCLCFGEACSRSTRYLNKKNNEPFYLRYEEVDCKDKDGRTLKNERGEIQKCTQLKDQLIKANRTEVFYADKLCRLDLAGLKAKLKEIIKKQLEKKKQEIEEKDRKTYDLGDGYTDDLSQYDYVEIEAWGGGEAGHIKNTAHSTESRPGMPGDYIKAKLKIDPSYPVIKVEVTEGGGGQEDSLSNKDGGPTWIEICNSHRQDCKPLITVAGGGVNKLYGGKEYSTQVHVDNLASQGDLKLEKLIVTDKTSTDNQIAYIKDGEIKYEAIECNSGLRSSKPGAGGCIDKSRGTYSRGSPGYVEISAKKTDYEEINYEKVDKEVEKIIDALVKNPGNDPNVSDLIEKLHSGVTQEIKEEIKKELLEK